MNLNITKNDKKARLLIFLVSAIIFIAIVILGRVKVDVNLGFDEHVFAKFNAIINTVVAFLLLFGLISAKQGNYTRHKNIMLTAICFSVLFLVFYICHHLFAGETKYGGAGSMRYFYYFILGTHIVLADHQVHQWTSNCYIKPNGPGNLCKLSMFIIFIY